MRTAPLLSIGLYLYNGDRFLEAVIESILNQTFWDFELIISDNCSTDRSGEICRRFADQDSRIRYYRAEHNMSADWNLRDVYFKAIGKYFKWATHDDMIQPDFLRLCIDALEADDSLVVAHTLTRERPAGWQGYGEHIEHSLDLAEQLRLRLTRGGWRVVNQSPLAVVCIEPPDKTDIREIVSRVLATGKAWVSVASFEGREVIRACVTSGEATENDVADLVDCLEEAKAWTH